MFGKKKKSIILVSGAVGFIILQLASPADAQNKSYRLSIGSAPAGTTYYALAGAMASIISKHVPNAEATAESTNGSVDNCKLVSMGKVELGLTMNDVAYSALKGEERFISVGPSSIRTLAVMFPFYLTFVTLQNSGINTVFDLKGKRVAVGAPGAGTEVMTKKVLESYGMSFEKDIKKENLHGLEATNALKDRKVDAFTWVTGLPTAAILDVDATTGVKIKLINNSDHLEKITAQYGPIYSRGTIPKGTYPHVDYDSHVLTTYTILICHEKMDTDLVYNIIKSIIEYQPDIVRVYKGAEFFSLKTAGVGSALPFHPGSVKYFKEKGIKVE